MIRGIIVAMAAVALSLPLNAQTRRFVEVSTQYPIISEIEIHNQGISYSSYYPLSIGYSILESYKTNPGINISTGHHFKLPYGIGMKTGAGISWVGFHRSVKVKMPSTYSGISDLVAITGQPIGSMFGMQETPVPGIVRIDPISSTVPWPSENIGKTNILYLIFPVGITYGFLNDKLILSAGISGNLMLWSRQVKNRFESNITVGSRYVEYTDTSSDGLSNFLINTELSASWLLIRKIGVVATYNHGLTPVYDPDLRFAGKSYIRNVSLGIEIGF